MSGGIIGGMHEVVREAAPQAGRVRSGIPLSGTWKPDLLKEGALRPGGDRHGVGWLERSGKMRFSVSELASPAPRPEALKRKPTFTLPGGSSGYA
jgi:hypothetical protein